MLLGPELKFPVQAACIVSTGERFCTTCGTKIPSGSAFCPNCGTPVSGELSGHARPVEPALSGLATLTKDAKVQSYWLRRVVAFVIDAVLVNVALSIIALMFALPVLAFWGPGAFGAATAGVFSFASGILLFLYFLLVETIGGSSMGKRLLGLKVTAAGGRAPNIGESALRNLSKIYWLLLLFDVIVGLATSKQYTEKYSDSFAGTSVVSA